MSPACPAVSVVIATYRREKVLCDTITDVLSQEYPAFEVVVVDQSPGHDPETLAFLEAHKTRIAYHRLERPNLPAARNYALRQIKGDIVIFVDDDIALPHRHFVAAHVAGFSEPRIGGVAGRVTTPGGATDPFIHPHHRDPYVGWQYTNLSYTLPIEVETARGANMSFRRDLLIQLGGFDEHYIGVANCEDTDMCMRLRAQGYRIMFEPDAHVIHYVGDTRHLHGKSEEAQRYYYIYFRNYSHFILKNIPWRLRPRYWWGIYRHHVLNRAYLRTGLSYLIRRHGVLLRAVWDTLVVKWQERGAPVTAAAGKSGHMAP